MVKVIRITGEYTVKAILSNYVLNVDEEVYDALKNLDADGDIAESDRIVLELLRENIEQLFSSDADDEYESFSSIDFGGEVTA
jgi:hypothetical protein